MSSEAFTALVIDDEQGKPKAHFISLKLTDLPAHDVLVEVAYSTLNYKDGLAVSGKGRIARKLPMVAGIDIAGTVVESACEEWKPGDKVIVNGWACRRRSGAGTRGSSGSRATGWCGCQTHSACRKPWRSALPATQRRCA